MQKNIVTVMKHRLCHHVCRAASGILLHVPPGYGPPLQAGRPPLPWAGGSLLMDCGEGTWGAMVRWLGVENAATQVCAGFGTWNTTHHLLVVLL